MDHHSPSSSNDQTPFRRIRPSNKTSPSRPFQIRTDLDTADGKQFTKAIQSCEAIAKRRGSRTLNPADRYAKGYVCSTGRSPKRQENVSYGPSLIKLSYTPLISDLSPQGGRGMRRSRHYASGTMTLIPNQNHCSIRMFPTETMIQARCLLYQTRIVAVYGRFLLGLCFRYDDLYTQREYSQSMGVSY